jgi:pyruvate ferredoxin oxidoreductase gamma subunit
LPSPLRRPPSGMPVPLSVTCTVSIPLAVTHLGRPLPGAALLGGFAALTWAVSLNSVLAAINDKFTGTAAQGNAATAQTAFEFVRDEREALTEAAIS